MPEIPERQARDCSNYGQTQSGEIWLSDGSSKAVNQYNLSNTEDAVSLIIFKASSHAKI